MVSRVCLRPSRSRVGRSIAVVDLRLSMAARSGWGSSIIAGGRPEKLEDQLARGAMAVDIDAPDSEGESTLMHACRRTDADGVRMVEILLAHGADPAKGIYEQFEDPPWIPDWEEEFEEDLHPPSVALVAAKKQAVELRARGRTPAALEQALRTWASTPNAQVEEGGELVLAGADINGTGDETGGKTALILACEQGLVAQVRLLLSKGAAPGQCSNEGPTHSPLYYAEMGRKNGMVSDASDHDKVIHMMKGKGQKLSSADEAWFRRSGAQGSPPAVGEARGSGEVEGMSASPPPQRRRVEPPASSGGWGAFAEPRDPWETFEGKLYKRYPNDMWQCLVCAQCKQIWGRVPFVTHLEGRKHHQVTIGIGGGGGIHPYERGVPTDDPMRKVTEQMHHAMLRRQDAQTAQSSHEARVNQTAAGDGDVEGGLPGAVVGGRATQEYWRKQQRLMAERELLKRVALEKQIKAKEAEEMRLVRRNRVLEDQLQHYVAKRRECREQSAELSKQRDAIEVLTRQLARAEAEATQHQSSIEEVSAKLSNMTIDRVHEGEKIQRLRSQVEELRSVIVEKNNYAQKQSDCIQTQAAKIHEQDCYIQGQDQLLTMAKAALVRFGQQVSDNPSHVSIASSSDAETQARLMQLEHDLDQAQNSKVTLTNRLRDAKDDQARARNQRKGMQATIDNLTRENASLKAVLRATADDRRLAEKERDDAVNDKRALEQELVERKSELQQERSQRKTAENELDSLRREGHGKDYSDALRDATTTIANVLGEEDGAEAKRAVRDQLLRALPGGGQVVGHNAAARGLVNFAEILELMCSFESASNMVQEMSDQKQSIQEVQTAAVRAMAQCDHWNLPSRSLGTLDCEALYQSLDRRPGRPFNQLQKQSIFDELQRAGAGVTLERNPEYSRAALGENKFTEVNIVPPLETWTDGEPTIDKEHEELVRIKEDYGEAARDAVIQCRLEQLKYNPSGGSPVTKIMESETSLEVMQPGKIVERMSVWVPGYMQIKCFSTPEQLASPASAVWQTFHVADSFEAINATLRHQGLLDDGDGDAEIYLKRTGEGSSLLRDDELLGEGERLEDRIDPSTDLVAGKLTHIVLVAI